MGWPRQLVVLSALAGSAAPVWAQFDGLTSAGRSFTKTAVPIILVVLLGFAALDVLLVVLQAMLRGMSNKNQEREYYGDPRTRSRKRVKRRW